MGIKDIKTYCINLPQATERRERVTAEFNKVGLDVEFIDGIYLPKEVNGLKGCTQSMLKVFGKCEGLDYVCIFEDDVAFADDFWQRVNLDLDFDIFYLGGHSLSFNFTKTSELNIYRVVLIGGTYAVIYSRKAIDFMLKNMTEDGKADAFVGGVACRELKAFCRLPFPVYTNDNYSWIDQKPSNLHNPLWQYEPKWDVSKEYMLQETPIENPSLYDNRTR